MYNNLKNKKILILGSQLEEQLVEAAHEMGLYVIVSDNIKDRMIARAKNVADEAWDIDYNDLPTLMQMCKASGVEGIFAGYGEYRVLAASRLAKALGLPFYATEKQIEMTRDKHIFREMCKKYRVSVPKNYAEELIKGEISYNEIPFPVIVKPTDRSGRIGISICNDINELKTAIEYALSKSESKMYVIEDFLKGTEFTSVYTASNGEISLSCIDAKYVTKDQKTPNFLCDCALAPAPFTKQYIEEVDGKIKKFLFDIGVHDGMANFQGMYTENGIYLFEMGLRLNGNNDWIYIEKENGINQAKMMMAYSLSGSMVDDIRKDNPFFHNYYCTLPIYAHSGVIMEMSYDKVLKEKWASISTINAQVGSEIIEDGTSRQKLFAILITAESIEELRERILFVQKNIIVRDTDKNNMAFKSFDITQLD